MATVCPVFNTNRMVQEYVEKCYCPSTERYERLTQDNLKQGDRPGPVARASWPRTGTRCASSRWRPRRPDTMQVGAQLEVQARVNLGSAVARRRGGAALSRPGRQPGRDPATRRTAPMSHNGAADGQHLGVPRQDSVPGQRPVRLRGAGAAEQRRSGQFVRAGHGVLGLSSRHTPCAVECANSTLSECGNVTSRRLSAFRDLAAHKSRPSADNVS